MVCGMLHFSNQQTVGLGAGGEQEQIGLDIAVAASCAIPNQGERIHAIDQLIGSHTGYVIEVLAEDFMFDLLFAFPGMRFVASGVSPSVQQTVSDVGWTALPRSGNRFFPERDKATDSLFRILDPRPGKAGEVDPPLRP